MKIKWIHSSIFDLIFILGPPFLAVFMGVLISPHLEKAAYLPFWFWFVFIVCVDVGHVHSTLFRTYFIKSEREKYSTLLFLIPLVVWVLGVILYSFGEKTFWTVLAYTAVFHFVRQQYGLLAIYQNEENLLWRKFEGVLIYLCTIYPLVFWHTHPDRIFQWFIKNDFVFFQAPKVAQIFLLLEVVGLGIFIVRLLWRRNLRDLPKSLVIFGTALSWYVGIVHFNSDVIFTVTNVFSHGIPYYALIWAFHLKMKGKEIVAGTTIEKKATPQTWWFVFRGAPLFILVCILFAYVEEGLWSSLHWRNYIDQLQAFDWIPRVRDHAAMTLLIPLLALPQATHYILDGFIWRLRDSQSRWTQSLKD